MANKGARPTKKSDIIVFVAALLVVAYFARHELLFFIQDKGSFLLFDSEYDDYLVAESEARPLAKIIHDACNRKKACPLNPENWMLQLDGIKSVRRDMAYLPVTTTSKLSDSKPLQYNAFLITYDYALGWQLLARGGVDTQLMLERRKN